MDNINASLEVFWEKIQEWLNALIAGLPNLILAAFVLVIAVFLSRYVRKYITKLIGRFSNNLTINSLISNIATAAFLLIMLFIVLGILGLDTALTSLLAGAGVVGLAVGLAVQDPLMNVFSGILMSTKSLYNVGDLVETNGYFGIIEAVNLRSTILRKLTGEMVLLPNTSVIQSPLINYSASGLRRIDLSCGISYGDDLEKVKAVTLNAITSHVDYDNNRPVEFFYESFGDSSINFIVRYWLSETSQKSWLEARSQGIMALKAAFDQNDIMIPFPIRTLDFGIKGGEKLDSMLKPAGLQND